MADTPDVFEYSEFSMYEILYMGHEGLTYLVESMIDPQQFTDPFEIIAALEERMGKPLAQLLKETPM